MTLKPSPYEWTSDAFHSVRHLGGTLDYPIDAIGFLLETVATSGGVSSRDVGELLRVHAIQSFGDDASSVLRSWNILRSEDVGIIIEGLVHECLLIAQDGDSLDHFQDQFDLDSLFQTGT